MASRLLKLFTRTAKIPVLLLGVTFMLSFPSVTQAGLCEDIADKTEGFFSCGQEQTTLTDFEGGLTAPDASGYAPGLTQATDAREYVKNVVNFALGFLGLIAIVVIIYGGFLYVTAAGDDDKAGKGKKSVTFAIIGILMILGSYAIVNTILRAPSGSDQTLNGSAPNGTVTTQDPNRRVFFNYASIAVQTIARDFVTAYQNYSELQTDILSLTNFEPERDVRSPNDLRAILQNKRTILTNMRSKAGSLSQVAERADQAMLIIDKHLRSTNERLEERLDAADDERFTDWGDFWLDDYNIYRDELSEAIENGIKLANEQDFAYTITKIHERLTDLYTRINIVAPLPTIQSSFQQVFADLKGLVPTLSNPAGERASLLKNLASLLMQLSQVPTAYAQVELPNLQAANANNAYILQTVNHIGSLYDLIKDIKFVYAAITVDVREGNAPLIVNFDALRSLDPNNNTIPAENYVWEFGDPSAPKATGPTTTYTFNNPGTYVVKLQIKAPRADTAKGQTQVADGIAYQTITVKPPSSRINVRAVVNSNDYVLSQYNESGIQVKNLSNFTITNQEAKNGIIFDASRTQTGGGELFSSLARTSIAKIKWDFGDPTNTKNIVEGPPDSISQTQNITYSKEGSYRVLLEVTDDRGISDRKIFNLNVNQLAARINVMPGTEGKLGDEFTFDGAASSSDSGQIKTYEWQVMKEAVSGQSKDVTPASADNKDSFKFKFTEPGTYRVKLTVNDGARDASTDLQVTIESKPPIAQFTMQNPDKTQPNTYVFDASKSYDPDSSAQLAYKWEINAAPGDCVYLQGTTQTDCTQAFRDFSKDPKIIKPKLKFKKGTYTITLDVQDESEPGKSQPMEQTLTVDSDLDVGWGDDGKPLSTQLKDGKVDVTFAIKTSSGVAYELDTGDGAKESGNITGPITNVKHTYTKAGAFKAKLTVFDSEDNGNSTIRKVFIASAEKPVAVISATKDGENIQDLSEVIVANRKTAFNFDAAKSLNIDGTGRRLTYTWDFGDGTRSTSRQVNHTFKEITPAGQEFYRVTLKVTDQDDPTKVSEVDDVRIKIESQPPVIKGLTVVPVSGNLTTPVTVNVVANGAEDADGRIVSYKWWYYDMNDPDTEIGLQITQTPQATLTIGTKGEQDEQKTYGFAVVATDNENQTFDTSQELNESLVPTLTVTNGPNKAPVARLTVDRATIYVNESINFASSSTDPDEGGRIVTYVWDFEGNGFGDNVLGNEYNKPNVSYTYKNAAPDGIKVRLKVIDNNGAESISDPVTIYVDPISEPPKPAFTAEITDKKVKFTNNSTADTEAGANIKSYQWDFDVETDSNGDGIKDNDLNATEASPTFEYPDYGVYRARLTIEDDKGNKASVTNFVNVRAPASAGTTVTEALDARLTSLPEASADGKIHLQGDRGTVIFNFMGSRGNIVTYIIDSNTYFDSNGNGTRDDDEDYKASAPGIWTSSFVKSASPIRVRLTVIDSKGQKDNVEKDIVFDAPATPKPAGFGAPTSGAKPTLGDPAKTLSSTQTISPKRSENLNDTLTTNIFNTSFSSGLHQLLPLVFNLL